jgi:hypothetical protein
MSPPDEVRVYLGKEIPPTEISSKNSRLHYLNIIPQHCRSKFEEDTFTDFMIFFIDVKGGPCGLSKNVDTSGKEKPHIHPYHQRKQR